MSNFAEGPFTEWVLARPPAIQKLMIDWPPEAQVKTREDVALMVPAPGQIGTVMSWFEAGNIGVLVGFLRGECDPAKLEIVEFATFGETLVDHDLIRSIVDAS